MRFAFCDSWIHPSEGAAFIVMPTFLRGLSRLYHVHVLRELKLVSLSAIRQCLICKCFMHINGILKSVAVVCHWVFLLCGWIYWETILICLIVKVQRYWSSMHIRYVWLPSIQVFSIKSVVTRTTYQVSASTVLLSTE